MDELLTATLDEAEILTNSQIGFFHFVEPDENTLSLQAWSSRTVSEMCAAEGKGRHYDLSDAGIWADCVRQRRAVIHNDYASLSNRRGLPPGHAAILRELTVPITRTGRIVAIIGVGNKPVDYNETDLELVSSLADLIWDVTELKRAQEDWDKRRKAEQILSHTQDNYRNLMEQASDGIFISDADGHYLDVNEQGCLMTGYTKAELLQKEIKDLIAKEDLTRDPVHYSDLATGKPLRLERNLQRKDGTTIAVESSARQLKDGRIMAIIRDRSEQKKIVRSLRESEERFRSAVEQSGDGFELLDEFGGYLDVNATTCRMLGRTRTEILKMKIADIDPLVNEARFKELFQSMQGKPAMTFESQHIHKDGTIFPVEITTSIILIGGTPRALSMVRDIRERKRIEASHVKNEKLESLGTLAGGIAHDFNNLLSGVYGYLDLARRTSDPEQIKLLLVNAGKSIERARKLTLQLLTFAKGGTPNMSLGNLSPFLEETVMFALSGSGIEPMFALAPDLKPVQYDSGQLGQVVDNIVINARQASDNSGVIFIRAENIQLKNNEAAELKEGQYVRISFQDEGAGIEKEIQNHIFEPFYTTKTLGSGLGLATAFSIMKQHGGAITVDSKPGKGSVFHIFLPAGEAARSPEVSLEISTNNSPATGRILIMDDDPVIRDVLSQILVMMGYSVESSSDGKETLAKFESVDANQEQFKALIVDLTVPGGTGGLEVVKQIRKTNSDIPVFVMSGYSDELNISEILKYGFSGRISKPFTVDELSSLLNSRLH